MKKILSILLTLCLILCLAPVTAQAEGAVYIIREGETWEEVAAGEYVENHGTVVTNNGTVIENYGTVSNNLGTVTENHGTVINNNGTVTNNYKDVTYNKSGSIIEANCSDGYVYGNDGTVTVNEGTIDFNRNKVDKNKITGVINTNRGSVQENLGTIRTNDNYYGDEEVNYNNGTIEENKGIVSTNVKRIDTNAASGIVLNYNGGVVTTNLGKVYNYSGTISNKSTGTEYYRIHLVNMATHTAVSASGMEFAYDDYWLAEVAGAQASGTFTLTPDPGYEIKEIDPSRYTGNVTASKNADGTWTLTVTSGCIVSTIATPEATIIWYTVTVINGLGNRSCTIDEIVTVTANAPEANMRFKEWTATGITLTDAQKKATSFTFTMPANNVTLTATYEQLYTVTVVNGTGGGSFAAGDSVTVTANAPEANMRFKEWTATGITLTDAQKKATSFTFTMPANAVTLTATYESFADGYYLIGQNGWTADDIDLAQQFTVNPANANEYMLETTLAEGDTIKVVRVADGAIAQWYPDPGDNYTVTSDYAGSVTIYFKPTYDSAWSAFGGHIWIVRKTPAFVSQNLILSGEIGVQFFVDVSMLDDPSTAYMTFTIDDKAGKDGETPKVTTVPYTDAEGTPAKLGFKFFVNAIQMADTITATLHYGDSQTIEKTYSVKDYVEAWDVAVTNGTTGIENETLQNKTTALIHALADYGHYVQIFLSSVNGWTLGTDYAAMMENPYAGSYDVDEIKGITTAEPYQMTFAGSEAFKDPSMSLVLDSETAIRIFLANADGTKLNADDVTVSVTPPTGITWNAETQLQKTQKGNRVMVEIRGIKAAWLAETFTITATKGDNTQTITVSALSYVGKLLDSATYADNAAARNAVCALYAYAMAARDYDN